MNEDIKYPVPRLLPKRARKLRKLRSMWPELANRAVESDAMATFMAPVISDQMMQISADNLDLIRKQDSPGIQQAQTLGFGQKNHQVSLRSERIVNSGRLKSVFEVVSNSSKAGFPSKPTARHFTGIVLEQLNDGWREAGFTGERTGVSAKVSAETKAAGFGKSRVKPPMRLYTNGRRIEFTTAWIVNAKNYTDTAYVYNTDRRSVIDQALRPDLWEMYRALKTPEGFSKPFCSLPGPTQHRVLIGVVNVFSTPLPQGAIVVQCEFFNRHTSHTRKKGVRQGYMVFHPEVPFYGFGWTARKAISDMKKSMAKRLTEVVRQSSS